MNEAAATTTGEAPRGTATYVYAVAAAGTLPATAGQGVAEAAMEVVDQAPLEAVVSHVEPSRMRLRRRDLRRHLDVLEQAFAATTVLPCGFGTLVEDDATLRAWLAAHERELLQALARLEGASQLNVTVAYDEEAVLREIVAQEPAIARLREATRGAGAAGHFERVRLGELVAAALDERRARDADRVLARLERAADEVVLDEADGLVVLKGSFLVREARAFDRALEQLADAERPRLRVEAIGPLPPTAFAARATPGAPWAS